MHAAQAGRGREGRQSAAKGLGPLSHTDCGGGACFTLRYAGAAPADKEHAMTAQAAREVSLQDLPDLRLKTERVSQALSQQLGAHLETLRPLYAPERIFGKVAGGKVDVATAERALSDVKEKYASFTSKPFLFPPEFDLNWLTLTGSALELLPWEYPHDVAGKPITMTTPLRWVLNYKSGLSIGKLRAAV